MATIATHNGTQVCYEHNIRNPKVVAKQKHIDPNGIHEIWKDEKVRAAYHRLFGQALKEYNNKQEKEERKISNYYQHICNDAKKHDCYEMIVGVYGHPDQEKNKEILKEFVQGWTTRNPNLEMIGAYYHLDEPGEAHVHIDYIPVARNCKRGLQTQNSLTKALEQMGYKTKASSHTAQMQWQKSENQHLEKLCRDRNIDVEHPAEKGKKHLETEQYKAQQRLAEASKTLNKKQKDISDLSNSKNALEREIEALQDAKGPIGRTGPLKKANQELQQEVATLKATISDQANEIKDLLQDNAALNRKIDRITPSIDEVILKAENEHLKAENTRLRESLNKIKNFLKERFPVAYQAIEKIFGRATDKIR